MSKKGESSFENFLIPVTQAYSKHLLTYGPMPIRDKPGRIQVISNQNAKAWSVDMLKTLRKMNGNGINPYYLAWASGNINKNTWEYLRTEYGFDPSVFSHIEDYYEQFSLFHSIEECSFMDCYKESEYQNDFFSPEKSLLKDWYSAKMLWKETIVNVLCFSFLNNSDANQFWTNCRVIQHACSGSVRIRNTEQIGAGVYYYGMDSKYCFRPNECVFYCMLHENRICLVIGEKNVDTARDFFNWMISHFSDKYWSVVPQVLRYPKFEVPAISN